MWAAHLRVLAAAATIAAASASSTVHVLLPDGRNLTLPATHTASTAALPARS